MTADPAQGQVGEGKLQCGGLSVVAPPEGRVIVSRDLMLILFVDLLSSFCPALDSTHGVASVTLHSLPGWGSPRFQHHNHFTEHEMKVPGTAKPLTYTINYSSHKTP